MDNKDNKESGREPREFSRSSSREEFESKDADAGGKDGPRGGGRSFGRRKVCPFVADKT